MRLHLKSKIRTLPQIERFIILQLDEIYVKQCAEYKSEEVIGYAINKADPEPAKTVQAYPASSAFGHFKEVVSLSPVGNLTGEDSTRFGKVLFNFSGKQNGSKDRRTQKHESWPAKV